MKGGEDRMSRKSKAAVDVKFRAKWGKYADIVFGVTMRVIPAGLIAWIISRLQ
jgi:hypothetical protein